MEWVNAHNTYQMVGQTWGEKGENDDHFYNK